MRTTATTVHAEPTRARGGGRRLDLAGLLLALIAATSVACDVDRDDDDVAADDDSDAALDDSSGGLAIDAAEYVLRFDWGAAEALDTGGWATTSDLGYRVEVRAGYLVAYSATLSPCTPATAADGTTTASLGERLLDTIMAPRTAFAGHADIADPSQIEAPHVEDLASPADSTFGAITFDTGDYCWAHYLAAAADDATEGLPDDADLDGVTLFLEGDVWLDEHHAEPFIVRTGLASGALVELSAVRSAPEGAGSHATLTITRHLGGAFDGFDFATDDPSDLDALVLRNLVQAATIELRLDEA